MNTMNAIPVPTDAHQILAAAVAHRIEHMSRDELQALVAKAHGDLQGENAALRQRVTQLEGENAKLDAHVLRLMYRISRSLFDEKDYENFDPSEYTVSMEELFAEVKRITE